MQGNPALWIIKMNMDGIHAGEWFRLERLERPYHMSVWQFCMAASTKSSTETGSNIFLRRNLTNSLAKDVHAAIRSKYALRIHPFRLSYKNLDVTFNHEGIGLFISSTASCLRNSPLEWNSEGHWDEDGWNIEEYLGSDCSPQVGIGLDVRGYLKTGLTLLFNIQCYVTCLSDIRLTASLQLPRFGPCLGSRRVPNN
jgi:hypothetical protein